MKLKLYTSFACSILIVLMLAGTGYGTTKHDGHVHDDVDADKRQRVSITEKSEVSLEVSLEKAPLSTRTVPTTTVRKWLEARANEESDHEGHSHEEPGFMENKQAEGFGGGWCNSCGCWMRHGCDPNGNCSIGHGNVCGSGACSLHPLSNCVNSG
jgi:hypothetical protein